jgi:hypothetical protein
VLEDDVDWDIRFRWQMGEFGREIKKLNGMLGRGKDTAKDTDAGAFLDFTGLTVLPQKILPKRAEYSTPYSLDWDVLWLGHCGTHLPQTSNSTSVSQPTDRVVLFDDLTVPASITFANDQSTYPLHTRILHRSNRTLCTLAYAVTQTGARKILYEHGIRNFEKGYDFALSKWCDGKKKGMGMRPMCLTSSPTILDHYWPMHGESGGGKSDIAGVGADGVPARSLVNSVRSRDGF